MKLILPESLVSAKASTTDPIVYYSRGFGLGWTFRRRIEMGLEMLPEQWKPTRILEVGYGSGIVLYNLASTGAEMHGLDLESEPHIVNPHLQQLGVTAKLAKGSVLNMRDLYDNNFFDLVISFSTLEHVRDITGALQELHRVTADDGFLLVGIPAVNRFMDFAFRAIGIENIAEHHVTCPRKLRTCIAGQSDRWLLEREQLPSWVPFSIALYHTFLLRKKNTGASAFSEPPSKFEREC